MSLHFIKILNQKKVLKTTIMYVYASFYLDDSINILKKK